MLGTMVILPRAEIILGNPPVARISLGTLIILGNLPSAQPIKKLRNDAGSMGASSSDSMPLPPAREWQRPPARACHVAA